MGKLLSYLEGMMTICFGYTGGLVKESKNGLPCFIELVDPIRGRAPRSRCKRNDRLCLTTHFTHSPFCIF